jgi:hypothetical protein
MQTSAGVIRAALPIVGAACTLFAMGGKSDEFDDRILIKAAGGAAVAVLAATARRYHFSEDAILGAVSVAPAMLDIAVEARRPGRPNGVRREAGKGDITSEPRSSRICRK